MPDCPSLHFYKCVLSNGDYRFLTGFDLSDLLERHRNIVSNSISITRLNKVTQEHLDAIDSLISKFN